MTHAKDDYEDWFPTDRDHDRELCPTCSGTGRVVAADGYHEYLGYNYLACPDCELGDGMGYPDPMKRHSEAER